MLGSGRSSSSNKSDTEIEEKKKCLSQFGAFLHMDLLLNLSILATFHGPINFDNVNKSSGSQNASLDSKQKNNRTTAKSQKNIEEHIRSPRNAFAPFFNERGIPEI